MHRSAGFFPRIQNQPNRLRVAFASRGFSSAVKFMAAALLAGGFAGRAHALTIVPTFDSSFNSAANETAAENAIQTAITTVDSLYNASGSIPVLFKYDASLGGGGESDNSNFNPSYNTWLSQMQSISTANPGNSPLSTAVPHLPGSGTISQQMSVTGVYSNLIMGSSLFLGFDSSGNFNGSGGQTYAAVITLSAPSSIGSFYTGSTGFNSEAVSAAEHEIDEVLGGGGAGTTITSSTTGAATQYGTTDFYRYASGNGTNGNAPLGARSYTANGSSLVYFSLNGNAAITDQQGNPIQFNQNGAGGADYGDFASVAGIGHIQDAFSGASASPLYTSASPEATMMEAIGYNLAVPEPATMTLLGGGLAGLALIRRRRVAGRS